MALTGQAVCNAYMEWVGEGYGASRKQPAQLGFAICPGEQDDDFRNQEYDAGQ
jgi:hypothetical protein